MNMYGGDGNDEKCGEINFGLDYDFSTQTLKLKIIQVEHLSIYLIKIWQIHFYQFVSHKLNISTVLQISGEKFGCKGYQWAE